MQPAFDPLAISRRSLDFEDYIDIARRQRAWIIGPVLAALTIAVVAAFLWPDTYVSTAVIRVVPPQVPEKFVPANVNTQMSQRINSMAQAILSRGTLTSIIETYGLYVRQRNRVPMEDVIEDMRRDISISDVRSVHTPSRGELSAFMVGFSYENRYLSQKVTQDLVSRFIAENTRERANQSAMTTQFLKDQWQTAKNELDAIEHKLTEFRVANVGRLPDQWMANLQQMNALEARLSSLNNGIGRANQDKLLLESELRSQQERLTALHKVPSGPGTVVQDERLIRMDRDIEQLERMRSSFLEHYKPTHPDVQRVEGQLAALRRDREALIKAKQSEPKDKTVILSPERLKEVRDVTVAVQRLQAQLQSKDLEIEGLINEVKDVNSKIKAYQQRVESTPVGEQEYDQLMRDRDLAQQRYDDLNRKMTQSEIATDLENRKQGETLELLDSASLPETPTDPNRYLIVLFGLAAGMALGALLAMGREMKDTSLRNLKDVRAYTQLTVLANVPLLENDYVVMHRRRLAWLAWSTASVISAITMSGAIYYYYSTKL